MKHEENTTRQAEKREKGEAQQPSPLCSSCESFMAALCAGSTYSVPTLLRNAGYVYEAEKLDRAIAAYDAEQPPKTEKE